jgi:hypothetical protein
LEKSLSLNLDILVINKIYNQSNIAETNKITVAILGKKKKTTKWIKQRG